MNNIDQQPDVGVDRASISLESKAIAAFLAFASGDALGWPQEDRSRALGPTSAKPSSAFRSWRRIAGGRFWAHEDEIGAGEYSDDTQLMAAVSRALLTGETWWGRLVSTELPLWLAYERGGGRATKVAARSWEQGIAPWQLDKTDKRARYFDAGGNGVAMRALPHAVRHARRDDAALLVTDVFADGVATHGHPRALVGASIYALAAWWLLRRSRTLAFGQLLTFLVQNQRTWAMVPPLGNGFAGWEEAAAKDAGFNYLDVWESTVAEAVELLNIALRGLSRGPLQTTGRYCATSAAMEGTGVRGTIAAAAAAYICARHAARPVGGVVTPAFLTKADTDTIAAMSGGLLGCVAGRDWLPTAWDSLQDRDYLRDLAKQLAGSDSTKSVFSPLPPVEPTIRSVRRRLPMGSRGTLALGDGREATLLSFRELNARSNGVRARQWSARASDGQTLFLTKLERVGSRPEAPPKRVSRSERLVPTIRLAMVTTGGPDTHV